VTTARIGTVDQCGHTLRQAQGERRKFSEIKPPTAQAELVEASFGRESTVSSEGIVGAVIMLGTLFGLIALIFGLVLRYDPEACRPAKREDGDG
jgi:hypothetical protein